MEELFCNLDGSEVFYDCDKDLIIKTTTEKCLIDRILSLYTTRNMYIHNNYPKFNEKYKNLITTTFFFIPNVKFPFSSEKVYLQYEPSYYTLNMEIIKFPEQHIDDYSHIDIFNKLFLRKSVFFKFKNKKDLAKFKLIM